MIRPLPALAVVLLAAVCAVPAPAAPPDALAKHLEAVIDGPDYRHANWGLRVVDAKTGTAVYARNPEAMLAPASVTKLVPSAAALVALGPDSRPRRPCTSPATGSRVPFAATSSSSRPATSPSAAAPKDGKPEFKDKDHTYANSGLDGRRTDRHGPARRPQRPGEASEGRRHHAGRRRSPDRRPDVRPHPGQRHRPGRGPPILVNDNVIDLVDHPGAKPGDPAQVVARPESAPSTRSTALLTTGTEASAVGRRHSFPLGRTSSRSAVAAGRGQAARPHLPVEEPAMFARALFIEGSGGTG